jgi:hypothetical protein
MAAQQEVQVHKVADIGVKNSACKISKKIKDSIRLENTLQNIDNTIGLLSFANSTQALSLLNLYGFQETVATAWNSTTRFVSSC